MPLKHSKSEKAFKSNIKTEMEHGKSQPQSLAIAYSVKRKAKKKASGGTVESGSPDMNYADGGEAKEKVKKAKTPAELSFGPKPKSHKVYMAEGGAISASNERRPMPDDRHNDSQEISRNSSKKSTPQDQWTDQPTLKQSRSKGMRVTPIKHPKMVPQSSYTARLRDEEDHLEESASPGPYDAQPPHRDDEEEARKQGKDPDMTKPHTTAKAYAKGGKINDAVSFQESEEDQDPDESPIRESYMRPNESDYMSDHEQMLADGGAIHGEDEQELNPAHGHFSPDDSEMRPEDEYEEEQESSLADAIMAKHDKLHKAVHSDSDMDEAAQYFEGGPITDHREHDDILSHDSIFSDDSDQVDLSRNADEDANEEDHASFHALMKENYSESDALDKMDQPRDSNLKGDSEEAASHDEHDRVDRIMRRMRRK